MTSPISDQELQHMENGTTALIDLPIGTTFITKVGKGQPLLILHGGLGLDHSGFRPYMDAIGESAQLIFVDLLGNGRSGHLPPTFATDHSVWVDQIDQLADALKLDQFVLLGHSHGGVIAQRYALAHPERLRGLILVTTGPSFDHVEMIMEELEAKSTKEQFEVFTTQIFVEQPDDETWAKRWRTVMPLYYADPPSDEDLDAKHSKTIHRAEGFNACILHVPHFDVRDRLHTIETPTLVIGGDKDFCFPKSVGPGLLAEKIPNTTLVMLANSGHNPFSEETEEFNRAIVNFLDSLGD